MTKEYFTFDEVNELIPQLEYHFQKLLFHKKEMAQNSQHLRKVGVIPQLIGTISAKATMKVHQLQAEVRKHYREYKNHLFSIESLGGEIKDLELGRVDFPSRKEGEDVTLTWQLGVTEGPCLLPKEEPREEKNTTIRVEISPDYTL